MNWSPSAITVDLDNSAACTTFHLQFVLKHFWPENTEILVIIRDSLWDAEMQSFFNRPFVGMCKIRFAIIDGIADQWEIFKSVNKWTKNIFQK